MKRSLFIVIAGLFLLLGIFGLFNVSAWVIDDEPFCGDGICELTEQLTCQDDCRIICGRECFYPAPACMSICLPSIEECEATPSAENDYFVPDCGDCPLVENEIICQMGDCEKEGEDYIEALDSFDFELRGEWVERISQELENCPSGWNRVNTNSFDYYINEIDRNSADIICSANLSTSVDDASIGHFPEANISLYEINASIVNGEKVIKKSLIENKIFSVSEEEEQIFNATFNRAINITSPAMVCELNIKIGSGWSGRRTRASTEYIVDIDGDGYLSFNQTESLLLSSQKRDCDDWPFDDSNDLNGFSIPCSAGFEGYISNGDSNSDKNEYCYRDTNKDGIGDFANCSYCRNPGMKEVADDIDNNCGGTCQGNEKKSCFVDNFVGDGNISADFLNGCGDVINEWGIEDNFCQMVDNGSSICGSGYERVVKYGYAVREEEWSGKAEDSSAPVSDSKKYCMGSDNCNIKVIELLVFKPGGISLPILDNYLPVNDSRRKNAMIGKMRFVKNTDNNVTFVEYIDGEGRGWGGDSLSDSKPQYDFLSFDNKEGVGQTTRGTVFGSAVGTQYIDSFRAEFNKKLNDDSIFDKFWGTYKDEISDSDFKWFDGCVIKDKCADGGDNDGPKDLYKMEPYKSNLKPITGVEINGEYMEKSFPFLVNVRDMDDASCKFNQGGEEIMASIYEPVVSAALGERSSLGLSDPHNRRKDEIYRKSDFTNEAYCIDEDGDGFCRNSLVFPDCIDGDSWIPQSPSSSHLNIFEDLVSGFPGRNTSSLGAFGKLEEELSPWHVHPSFSDVGLSCTFGRDYTKQSGFGLDYGLDLNCNKDGLEGYWNEGLYFGSTPFDEDSETGMEFKQRPINALDKKFFFSSTSDLACYVPISNSEKIFYGVVEFYLKAFVLYYGGNIVFGRLIPSVLSWLGVSPSVVGTVGTVGFGYFSIRGIVDTPGAVKGIYDTIIAMDEGTINSGDGVYQILDDTYSVVSSYIIAKSAFNGVGKESLMTMVTKASKGGKDLKKAVIVAKDNLRGQVVRRMHPSVAKSIDAGDVKTPGCFLENTSVMLENGSYVNIEDLKVGTSVVAWDLELNKSVVANVTATMVRDETKYRIIEYG